MKKFLSILLHSILFVLLIHSSSFAETVAVLDFKSLMTDDELGVAVAEILKTELAGLGEYTIIERGMLEQILEEQALQLSGAVDTDTAVKIGKLVGANVVVTGSIVKTGDMYTINSRFIDVETGIVNVGKNIRGQGENQISNMVQQLALILTGNAVVTEEPATTDATTEEPDAKDATQEPEAEVKDEPARTEESGNPEKRARDDEGTPSRHDLQQELVEVCLDKQEGAKCRIKGPRGRGL